MPHINGRAEPPQSRGGCLSHEPCDAGTDLEDGIATMLQDAGTVLLSMRQAGCVPAALRRVFPGFASAGVEAHGSIMGRDRPPAPSPDQVAEMETAYSLAAIYVQDMRLLRVVLLTSLTHPVSGRPFFGTVQLARSMRVDRKTLAQWRRRAVRQIAEGLRREAEATDHAA